jgi:hypothetical protein
MNKSLSLDLPDLIVDKCPFGCHKECSKVWKNELTGHQIVCKCECNHKIKTLVSVWGPETNVIKETLSSQEETQGNVFHR